VVEAKKSALSWGEDAVVKQIGEGKDIMSILCRWIIFCTRTWANIL
jgi:hypothetical protein